MSLPLPQIHPIVLTTAHSPFFIVCGEPLPLPPPVFTPVHVLPLCFSFDEDRSGSIDCEELLALTHSMGMTFLTEADVSLRQRVIMIFKCVARNMYTEK